MNQNSHDTSKPAGGRRRFLGAGVAATPALLTLVSQPALGATCFAPSRSLSKNMSVSQAGKYGVCNGVSPGNYKSQSTPGNGNSYNWPAFPIPSTPFHPLFSGTNFSVSIAGPSTRSLTFLEVLSLPDRPADVLGTLPDDPAKLGKHIAAAYLNVVKLLVPPVVLTTTSVLTIWSEWRTKGYYEPVAGVEWYAGDIVNYLVNSDIAP